VLSGGIAGSIVRLAAPLMVSSSVNVLYEVVDTFWLSRLGEAALAVPSIAWPYRGIVVSVCFGLTAGLSALVSQYVGAEDYDMARRSTGSILSLILAVSALLSALLAAGVQFYLEVMHVPARVSSIAVGYIEAVIASVPFLAAFIVFNVTLSSAGDTRTPMLLGVAASLLNAVLDPVFMFVLGLGVVGAGYATLASCVFSGTYSLYSFATGRHGVRLGLRDLYPDPGILGLACRVSAPVVAQTTGMTAGFAVMVGVVSGLGTPVIAAYSIGQVLLGIDRVFALPLTRATGIVVGQSLGAGMRDRARRAAVTGLALVTGAAIAYIGSLMVFSRLFIGAFTSEPRAFACAQRMLFIFGPSIVFFHAFMLANSVARGSGHTLFVSLVGLARLWLLRIPGSWLLAYRLGLGDTGLWAGMALSNYVAGAVAAAWLLSGRWAAPVIGAGGRKCTGVC